MFACPTSFQLIKQAGNFHLYPHPYITHTQRTPQGGGWQRHQLRAALQQQQQQQRDQQY